MILPYQKTIENLQELFQELADQGKISPEQAVRFNDAQKVLVNFHHWTQNQIKGNTNRVELPWDDEKFVVTWKLWKEFKKQQFQFVYRAIGEQGALKDLAELSGGNMETAIAIIHQSIKKGWQGLFALKDFQSTKKLVQTNQDDYKTQLLNRLGVQL